MVRSISPTEFHAILSLDESSFVDLKAKEIAPAKLSKTISAFANASGGEVYVGVGEKRGDGLPTREWIGFENEEAANGFFQLFTNLDSLGNVIKSEFLTASGGRGLVLYLNISKAREVIRATDGTVYRRVNAQSMPVKDAALDKLKFDKGVLTYEDHAVDIQLSEVANSKAMIGFLVDSVPTGEPEQWLAKQFLLRGDTPTVASVLLFSDYPQAILPKRSAVKVLRYQTKADAERDYLVGTPSTVEGPIYDVIYESVDLVKRMIEGIEKVGPSGMERVVYPQEALHELLTNAVLHRDYSAASDVQVRIFDNRVEIESPGRLPGHVTVSNIAETQFARNPKLVRIINKFTNPPNKDVGEGINTAFEAMQKLRLKRPEFIETESSVLVVLRHESLASPEQIVLEYLNDHDEITNAIARDLTGIKSENTMKNVFYRLRDGGQLEQAPKIPGKKHAWRKPAKQ